MCCDTLIHELYINSVEQSDEERNPGAAGWGGLTVSYSTFGISGKLLHLYFSFLICKMGLIIVITLKVMVWIK